MLRLLRPTVSVQPAATLSPCEACAAESSPPSRVSRYRGWYASAASGSKDVIIVIDTSGSMGQGNRMAYAKSAAQWVINTLSDTDYAQVRYHAITAVK